jgi:hypothetical protein
MVKPVLLVLLFALLPRLEAAEPAFEYGSRPASGVFDPERSLSAELTGQLTDELSKVRKRDLADVVVVVLPTTGEVPPEHLAQRFSDAWGKGPLHAVVLDATNRADGPWILFGGEVIRSDYNEIIPQMAKDILRRSHQEPDRESALRSAAFEASDMLRYLLGKVQTQGEAFRTDRLQKELDLEQEKRIRKFALYGGAAALLPAIGIVALLIMGLLRRRAVHFPPILWTRRFGAPYAGGNDATLDLTRRPPAS